MKINLKVIKGLFINYNWWGCLDPRAPAGFDRGDLLE